MQKLTFGLYHGYPFDSLAKESVEDTLQLYKILYLNAEVGTHWPASLHTIVGIQSSAKSIVEIQIGHGKILVSIESDKAAVAEYLFSFFKDKLTEKFSIQ